LTSLRLIEQNLSPMTPRFAQRAAFRSQRWTRRTTLLPLAGFLFFAAAGCSLFRPKTQPLPPPTQEQLATYAQQQTALRNDVSLPKEDSAEHCSQLANSTPGVEELRSNRGTVESRQWTLVANGSSTQWAIVKPNGGPPDGWQPKPGIDKLNFKPPLEPILATRSSLFLAYAPVVSNTLDDSQKAASVREVFGSAQGEFTWRGQNYSYTLTTELPCFSQMQ
jgi:hypothetical protein